MTTTVIKYTFLIILSLPLMKTQMLTNGQQQVSCLFFFGDSQFDNGNNNYLYTSARANYPPYGIDFPSGPNGRFSNGKNIADFLASLLGFSQPIAPYVTAGDSDILRGVNYASGGAGILILSGARLGQRFSMDRQLWYHRQTADRIGDILGGPMAADEHLRQCLYVVNIGSDDYIDNYYQPNSIERMLKSPERFAGFLTRVLSKQLRRLYSMGSRKVAVFGVGLIGCIPYELALYPTNGASPCVNSINDAVILFNNGLFTLINDLNTAFPDAHFTYINSTSIATADLSAIGIRVGNAACCEVDASTGQCIPNGRACNNRREYAFFDNIHPTQILNNVTAARAYHALLPTDAIPFDIQTLVRR